MAQRNGLTARQARFVAEYLIDLNATQAAIRAGYSRKTADVQGPRLLGNVGVAAAISIGKAKQLDSMELSAARVLEEIRRLATIDARGFFNADGSVKRVQDLTAEQGAALGGFEVAIKNVAAGDHKQDVIHKFKLWDKTRALELLAKHFALLTEQVHHTGGIDIRWKENE